MVSDSFTETDRYGAGVEKTGVREKPLFGMPCNGCGLCCQMEICAIGMMAFPKATAPCPALRFAGSNFRCAIVEAEASTGAEPLIAAALGIGRGCCSDDPTLTTGGTDER